MNVTLRINLCHPKVKFLQFMQYSSDEFYLIKPFLYHAKALIWLIRVKKSLQSVGKMCVKNLAKICERAHFKYQVVTYYF